MLNSVTDTTGAVLKTFWAAVEGQQHYQCLHINTHAQHDVSSWDIPQFKIPLSLLEVIFKHRRLGAVQ